ncbi:DUF6266 family protein [Pedobacter psychroterrae]|uniref:Uncharacterized protein n=1 Tax=Pedobacter psychroterrae TaxID=2530453 RepID=A0A4R0NS55_9SPHI|nr:DUF6266 family protein [Pedobacter psychroterrae]TCD02723.1 hypothetical protein EZ437_01670 [Pedobacter psychroterrae]
MARLKDGLLGGLSGKIGDVIGYIRYGKAYVKMKTLKPKKEASSGQLAEREKMKLVNNFINSMTEFVRIGFTLEASDKRHSANAAAKSYQMKNAISGVYPALGIEYSRVLLCKGLIDPPLNVSAAVLSNGLQFSWLLSNRTEVYHKRSRVMLLVYAPALNKSFYSLSGARIMEKTDFLELPLAFKGQLLHLYAAFHSDDSKQISNSTYAGTTNY